MFYHLFSVALPVVLLPLNIDEKPVDKKAKKSILAVLWPNDKSKPPQPSNSFLYGKLTDAKDVFDFDASMDRVSSFP